MPAFAGGTAVVTGGAAGIGRALAERCLAEGMNVVIADVETPVLDATLAELAAMTSGSGRITGRRVDVSNADEVDDLAAFARETFGAVHLLFNNAGVGAGSTAWESTLRDWTWVMGVNYSAVPAGAMKIDKNGVTYYLSGNTWFQPVYGANGVTYKVVPVP